MRYLEDHAEIFPAVSEVGLGQIAPHPTAETDVEGLFSIAGLTADPRRFCMNVWLHECLTMTRHRLGHKELYLKRHAAMNWDEKGERDTMKFLDLEKDIYLEMFPNNVGVFRDEDEEEEEEEEIDGCLDKKTTAKKIPAAKKKGSKRKSATVGKLVSEMN